MYVCMNIIIVYHTLNAMRVHAWRIYTTATAYVDFCKCTHYYGYVYMKEENFPINMYAQRTQKPA